MTREIPLFNSLGRKGQASKRNTTAIPRGFVVDGTNHTSKRYVTQFSCQHSSHVSYRQRHSMRNIETVNKDNHIPQVDFVLTSKRQSRTQRKSVVDVHNQLNTDSFRSAKPSQRMTTLLGKNLKLNVLSKKDEISQRCTTARRLPKIFISAHTGKFDEVYEILCPGGQLLVAAELQKVITQTSSDGTTVLHHSVVGGQIKIVEFLIQCKADLQASDVEGTYFYQPNPNLQTNPTPTSSSYSTCCLFLMTYRISGFVLLMVVIRFDTSSFCHLFQAFRYIKIILV